MPIDTNTLLGMFGPEDAGWVILDAVSGKRLSVSDDRFPGTEIVRFFMSKTDAERYIAAALQATDLGEEVILVPVAVPLIKTATVIAKIRHRGVKVGFVIHTPNEVFEALP